MLALLRKLYARLIKSAFDPAGDTVPDPVPEGQVRIHLFNGLDSENVLLAYCFDTPDEDTPTAITQDLPEAYVDEDFLEVRHHPDPAVALAGLGLLPTDLKRFSDAEGPGWIIATEETWGGFPYRLHDTPRVQYLGHALVDWS